MIKRKVYDKSFKAQAIQLALTSNQPIAKTAQDLGVLESTLYNWLSKYKAKGKSDNPATPNVNEMHEELLKLRKENQRLKDVCDILKKATAYFAKD